MNARENLFSLVVGANFPRQTITSLAEDLDTDPEAAGEAGETSADQLTLRERDILLMSSLGLCNKVISRRLLISVRSVENHRGSLRRKLGIGTLQRMQAMLEIIRQTSSQRLAELLDIDRQSAAGQLAALRQALN